MTVDGRAFTGSNITCSVNPFPNGASTPLLLGCNSAFNIQVTWVLVSGTRLIGCDLPNGVNGTNGAVIYASSSFSAVAPMLCWGVNGVCGTGPSGGGVGGNDFNAFNSLVEWVQIDCRGPLSNNGTATIGVQNKAGQENSGLSHFKVLNCSGIGVDWETSKAQHSFIEFGQIFIDGNNPGLCGPNTRMLQVGSAGATLGFTVPDVTFRQLTITIQGCTALGGSIAPTHIVAIDNCQNCIFENAFHIEGTQTGDLANGSIGIDIGSAAANSGVFIKGASCGNMSHAGGANSSCVTIEAAFSNTNITIFTTQCPSSCDTVLLDSQNSNTLTSAQNGVIGSYVIGNSTTTVATTASGQINGIQMGAQLLTLPTGSTSQASLNFKGFAASTGWIAAGASGTSWVFGSAAVVTVGSSGVALSKANGLQFSSGAQSTAAAEEGIGTLGKGILTVDSGTIANHSGYVFSRSNISLTANTSNITSITAVFSWPTLPAVAQVYKLECSGSWTAISGGANEALTISIASSVAPTREDATGYIYTNNAGTLVTGQQTAGNTSSGNQSVVGPTAAAATGTTTQPWRLSGMLSEPVGSGTFAVAFTGSGAGTAITINSGSWCSLTPSN
jgi:hypothetical protein